MESWSIFFLGIQFFFRTKLRFPKPLLLYCTQEISVRRDRFSTNPPLYMLHPYKRTKVEKESYLPKYKFINRTTLSRTFLQSAPFFPYSCMSPQVGLQMHRKLCSTFIRFEGQDNLLWQCCWGAFVVHQRKISTVAGRHYSPKYFCLICRCF